MRTGSYPVTSSKTAQKNLGDATYEIYETNAEAIDHLGEVKLLELLNAQVKTNAMNALRTEKTKGPTKVALFTDATAEIIDELTAGQHPDAIGKKERIQELVKERINLIEARMKEASADTLETDETEEAA